MECVHFIRCAVTVARQLIVTVVSAYEVDRVSKAKCGCLPEAAVLLIDWIVL